MFTTIRTPNPGTDSTFSAMRPPHPGICSACTAMNCVPLPQGSVNGGFQTVVRVLSGEQISLPPFYLNLTPFLSQFYLILTFFLPLFNLNLTSARFEISNHGLETTVYRPLTSLFYFPSSFYRRGSRCVAFQTRLSHFCFGLVRIKMPLLICFVHIFIHIYGKHARNFLDVFSPNPFPPPVLSKEGQVWCTHLCTKLSFLV